jgi:hypothetical protein
MKSIKDFLFNPPKKIAEWADENHGKQGNSSFRNNFYVFAMSFWKGTLLPKVQIEDARKKNRSDAIYTKYNTTLCYLTNLTIEYVPLFLLSNHSNNHTDDTIFWANLAFGAIQDTVRAYYAFNKNKPSTAISITSLLINLGYYSGKAIKRLRGKKRQN